MKRINVDLIMGEIKQEYILIMLFISRILEIFCVATDTKFFSY